MSAVYPYSTVWNSDSALSRRTTSTINGAQKGTYYNDRMRVLNVTHCSKFTVDSGFLQLRVTPSSSYRFPRIYLDIDNMIGPQTDGEMEFYAIKDSNVSSVGTKFGNHGTLKGDSRGYYSYKSYVFGGYGLDFHDNSTHDRIEYWHDWHDDNSKIITNLPSGHPSNTLIGYKIRIENVPGYKVKRVQAWMDYNADKRWVAVVDHILTNVEFNHRNGNGRPSRFPDRYKDSNDIYNAPHTGKLHRWWIRLNPKFPLASNTTLRVGKIKVRNKTSSSPSPLPPSLVSPTTPTSTASRAMIVPNYDRLAVQH